MFYIYEAARFTNSDSGNEGILVEASRLILHIDDDASFTRLIQTDMTARGYQVEVLDEPGNWFDTLRNGNTRIVILDIDMRRYSGLEILRDIKRYDSGIQVIILTKVTHVTTVISSLCAGAEFCLFKPLDHLETLVDVVERTFYKLDKWQQASQRALAISGMDGQLVPALR